VPVVDLSSIRIGHAYERTYLSALWGFASFQAISRGVVTPRGTNKIILFVTRQKQQSLTQYEDYLSGDVLVWEGEQKHGNDRRIARAHETGDEIHIFYRDIHHTAFVYCGQARATFFEPRVDSPSRFIFQIEHSLSAVDDLATAAPALGVMSQTTRETLIHARLGQGIFRQELLDRWHAACAVTGVSVPPILRASHIKPWRDCSDVERLSVDNGLLLLPQYDALFDRGLISFETDGSMILSPAIQGADPARLGISAGKRLREVFEDQREYFDYHRREIFMRHGGSAA